MQSTLVKHNKFFKAGHATSFDTAKKYAISCDASSSEYARVIDPGLITDGDFTIVINFRAISINNLAAFEITQGFRIEFMRPGTMRITIEDDSSSVNFVTNNDLTDGEWHTIVISCDRDGDLNYYEDYDAAGSGYTESLDISGVTGSIEGAGSPDWHFCYNGSTAFNSIDFDQIAVYDSALTSLQALTIHYALWKYGWELTGGTLPTPICYWKCNEGTGTQVANNGSESDILYLLNTPTWITDGII